MIQAPHPLRFATLNFICLEANLINNPFHVDVGANVSVAQS